jgi:phage shock protein B
MDEGIFGILLAPIIIFMIFVAPIWLILHYRSKKHVSQGLSSQEQAALKEMSIKAEAMSERIETLEAILDKEAPDWRQKA